MGLRGRVASAVLVGLALTACALLPDRSSEGGALQGTRWELVALEGAAPIEGTSITLAFGDLTIEGSAGCNTYGGSYSVKADSLQFDGIYATEMGCIEPEGILAQESAYLDALRAASSYEFGDGELRLTDEDGGRTLAFVADGGVVTEPATADVEEPGESVAATAKPKPTAIAVPPTATRVPSTPTPQAVPSLADGWFRYADPETGISLALPETWVVDTPEPPGTVTIVQSFPQDKYVGGEPFRPGDTKCDLWIHPPKTRTATLIERYATDPNVEVLSQEEVVLDSGQVGTRTEAEGMGTSLSMITEIGGRVVTFVCYGDLTPFNGIAVTLAGSE